MDKQDSPARAHTKLVSVRSVVGISLDDGEQRVIIDLLLIDGSLLGVKLDYAETAQLVDQVMRVGALAGVDLRRLA